MPLLFVISHLPFSMILKNEKAGCISGNYKATVNHPLFMGDVTFYKKTPQTHQIKGSIEKISKVWEKIEKYQYSEGIKLPNNKETRENNTNV